MSSGTNPKVAVLMGGPSAEREVSLSTGRECAAALRDAGYEVIEVDAGLDLAVRLQDIQPDVVFNALHGRFGEDGRGPKILDIVVDDGRPMIRAVAKEGGVTKWQAEYRRHVG